MRAEKIAIAREIREQLGNATFAILTDFTRMDTTKTMALRRKLREVAAAAKTLRDFIRTEKVPVVKLGLMDGAVLQAADVETLASLPGKKDMQGILVATIAAPMSNLVGVMSQKLASLVHVLQAAADKKSAA